MARAGDKNFATITEEKEVGYPEEEEERWRLLDVSQNTVY
jgi:hypothetical protein